MRKLIILFSLFLNCVTITAQTTFDKKFSPTTEQYAIKVFNTPDKGFLILGSLNKNYINTYIIKTDSLGDTLWTKTYGNDTIQYFPYDMCSLPDGGYLITGDFQVDTVYSMDTYVQKIDSAGNEVWFNIIGLQNYQGGSKDHGEWVRTLDNGTIIVGCTGRDGFWGINNYYNVGGWSPHLAKLDANGNLIDKWSIFAKIPYSGGRTYDMETIGNKIFWLGIGNGSSFDLGVFDENLDTVFTRINTLTDYYWLSATNDKCLLLFGRGKIAKMDTLGNILWTQTNSSASYPYDMIELSNGDFISIGMQSLIYTFTGFVVGNQTVYLNKFSPTGDLTSSKTINVPAGVFIHLGYSIVSTPDNGFAFTGYSGNDIWLVKVDSTFSITTSINENMVENNSFSIAPNPTNENCIISSNERINKIQLYNAIGETMLNENVNNNSYSLNLADFPTGIYLVTLTNTNGIIEKKKLVLVN